MKKQFTTKALFWAFICLVGTMLATACGRQSNPDAAATDAGDAMREATVTKDTVSAGIASLCLGTPVGIGTVKGQQMTFQIEP
jgi:hypothetical protein